MSDKQQNSGQGPTDPATLRKQAEEQARTMEPTQTSEEIQRMIPELRVRQIELEMQIEKLRTAQVRIDAERVRYFDLYDEAPVGYCTLSEQGVILEANPSKFTCRSMQSERRPHQDRNRLRQRRAAMKPYYWWKTNRQS